MKPLEAYREEELARMRLQFLRLRSKLPCCALQFHSQGAEIAHAVDAGAASFAPRSRGGGAFEWRGPRDLMIILLMSS